MISTPTHPAEFDALVPDEAAAEALLVAVRWPNGVTCPQCGSPEMTRLRTRPRWQCRTCRAQTSVRSGTVLHRTRVPLRDWLYAAWACSTSHGASTRSIAIDLHRRYETVFVMVHKLRAALAERRTWQLAGDVEVQAAIVPATKRAKGDPDPREPVVVALAVAEDREDEPRVDALRIHTTSGPHRPDRELLEEARIAHVELTAAVRVRPGRLVSRITPDDRASSEVRGWYRALRTWLARRFCGVSRRYLPNYLAQFTYVGNRWRAAGRRFGWVLRRLTREPWRGRAEVVLAAP